MANLILPRRFTQQPQYPVEVDWSHPLTRGLKFGWTASSKIDLVRRLVPSVDAPTGPTNKGIAAIGDGTNYVQFPSAPSVVSTSYSIYGLMRLTTTSEFYVVANEIAYTNQWRLSGYQSGGNLNLNAPGVGDYGTGARTVNSNVFSVGVSCDSGVTNGTKYYRSGRVARTVTATPPTLSGSRPVTVAQKAYLPTANPSGADILLVLMWDRPLSDDEQFALEQNPWQILRRTPQVLYFDAAGGGAYTLPTTTGSFTLTGNAAGLATARNVTASPASFTLTGNATTLTYTSNKTLTADVGSFTLTGIAANLTTQRKVVTSVGEYTLSGVAVGLSRAFTLGAETTSYTLTGTEAGLKVARSLTADTVSYSLTGNDATLTYVTAGTITAGTGAFSLTGITTGLSVARKLTATAGSFTLSGVDVGLSVARSLPVTTGSYTLTGIDTTLTATIAKKLTCETGSFVVSGKVIDFVLDTGRQGDGTITKQGIAGKKVAKVKSKEQLRLERIFGKEEEPSELVARLLEPVVEIPADIKQDVKDKDSVSKAKVLVAYAESYKETLKATERKKVEQILVAYEETLQKRMILRRQEEELLLLMTF